MGETGEVDDRLDPGDVADDAGRVAGSAERRAVDGLEPGVLELVGRTPCVLPAPLVEGDVPPAAVPVQPVQHRGAVPDEVDARGSARDVVKRGGVRGHGT